MGQRRDQNRPSVVLYGHRRMGKSSILQNLGGRRFGVDTLVAQCNMQRLGRVGSTGALLSAFALAEAHLANELTEPTPTAFSGDSPYAAFNRFVREAKPALSARRVALTVAQPSPSMAPKRATYGPGGLERAARPRHPLAPRHPLKGVLRATFEGVLRATFDEFELIEKAIQEGRVDAQLLDFLRGVIQTEPWLILVLAGLHTLQEMTADYWNPLFASVTPVQVGFLSLGATGDLLANPSDDFPLEFDRETVGRVYDHVRGQPYLTQLIGHTLVRRYNQSVFEEGQPRSPRFTPDDVDAVVGAPALYEQGSYYFQGVWSQINDDPKSPSGQAAVLRALAEANEPQTAEALLARAGLDPAEGDASLKALLRQDILVRTADSYGYDFAVPLMRQWVRAR